MRIITSEQIINAVENLVLDASFYLCKDVLEALIKAKEKEKSPVAHEILKQIIKNARIAANEMVPICQDTGIAVIFLEFGNQVKFEGNIYKAINEGVRQGYNKGYLRKSIVNNPIDRINTGDNIPAIIHTEFVEGDKIKITFVPKGGGSENMSKLKMLKPADGIEGISQFVIDTVKSAGANACPPVIVGVGVGGSFEKCAILAKKALLRPINDTNENLEFAKLEEEILVRVNSLGIGAQGLGGSQTALAVKIETYPCHIASLPVAVNLNCHVSRHKEIVI
ncbi:MAG TPA: fumarate hydratase [Halanaerobiales bacterium]|nr:fumarate hydratase [Halanaerobiales bacterium]